MRHAIISDIHASAIALRATLTDLGQQHVNAIHCLGDVVGYHAQPHEVIAILRHEGIDCVVGNHDRMACSDEEPIGGPLARAAIEWTRRALEADERAWLEALPVERRLGDATLLVHALPWSTETRLKDGVDFAAAARELEFSHPWVRLCFTGHTHVAGFAHLAPDGSVTIGGRSSITIGAGAGIWFVNPGSVGLPRDGSPGARYAIYDDVTSTITSHCAPYDMEAVNLVNQQRGLETRVPESARRTQPTPLEGLDILRVLSGKA